MNRGVVMQIQKNRAIVLTADGRFINTALPRNVQVGDEIVIQQEERARRKRPKALLWRTGVAAAIVLLILPVLLYVQSGEHPVVAYFSMDINPSIEIGIDSREQVQELHAFNEAGKQLIAGVSYKNKSLALVTTAIMQKIAGMHYFDDKVQDIVVTSVVIGGDDPQLDVLFSSKLNKALTEMVADGHMQAAVEIMTLSAPVELRDAAEAYGLSSGKMAVYLMAKDEGYDLELENFQQHSISMITEPLGGVKTIMKHADKSTKESLRSLLEAETKQEAVLSSVPVVDSASAEPAASPTPAPILVSSVTDAAASSKPAETATPKPPKPTAEAAGNETPAKQEDNGKSGQHGKDKEKDKVDINKDKDKDKNKEKDKNKDKNKHENNDKQENNQGNKNKNKDENNNENNNDGKNNSHKDGKNKDTDKNKDKDSCKKTSGENKGNEKNKTGHTDSEQRNSRIKTTFWGGQVYFSYRTNVENTNSWQQTA
ncbi:Anti-sigma factor N-terminus [Paenibacillus algorifonticola]|uniref:Anti-sigma factor N-terminus n=2 Tax=Paenibacillus algorifonticola TaxID=684063 RepID=A0A1I2FZ00_9BACL|nr:Anti-sigma factor N-terminus [Paenibacillus algorifonticola]